MGSAQGSTGPGRVGWPSGEEIKGQGLRSGPQALIIHIVHPGMYVRHGGAWGQSVGGPSINRG